MKQSNIVLVALLGIVTVSCSYGMDISSVGNIDKKPQPLVKISQMVRLQDQSFIGLLSQSTLSERTDRSEEMYQPLAKPSFLEFYKSVNVYLKNKKSEDLSTAKTSLQNIIDHEPTIGLKPFSTFLESNNPDESLVKKLKPWVNTYYFFFNKNDLCKAIPHFLKNMTSTDQNTIRDAENLLQELRKTSDSVAEKNIEKIERQIKSINTNIQLTDDQLTDDTLRTCWDLLDEVCNVIPRQAFQRASNDLTELLLVALLSYNGTPEHDKLVIAPVINNINSLIDFISKQKRSKENTRIAALNKIKEDINRKTKTDVPEEDRLSRENINNMIKNIENIVDVTLNPNDMMESSLQLEQIQQEKEEFAREQKAFEEEQEKASDMLLFTDSEFLMNNPDKLLNYMNKKNWDAQTKTYALQLLFWFTQKEASGKEVTNQNDRDSSFIQRSLIQTLKKIGAQAPGIVRKRGYKTYPRFTNELITNKSTQEAERDKSFDLQQLPENAPTTLKQLFDRFKKQELENQRENPNLAIKTYAQDIQEQKDYLAQQNENFRSSMEHSTSMTNLEKMVDTAKNFYSKYPLSPQTNKDIDAITRADILERGRDPKIYTPGNLKLQAEVTEEELSKLITQNQQFAQKRLAKKLITNKSTQEAERNKSFEKDHSKRISEKFAASLSTKQAEMQELIQKQVDKLNNQIPQTKGIDALNSIKSQLDNYKQYVSENNTGLKDRILNALKNTDDKILADKLITFETNINSKATADLLTYLITQLKIMKKDQSITLAQTSKIRALMVTAQEKLRGNQEAPQEKTATIKETIAKEAFDSVKENVKANKIEWLFRKENYDAFPSDLSLAYLFEIIEDLESKNSAPYAATISQLNTYITQSIIPEKIETVRDDLILFINTIPTVMQQIEEEEIKNKELLEKQAQAAQTAKKEKLAKEQAMKQKRAEQERLLKPFEDAKAASEAQAKTTATPQANTTAKPTPQPKNTEKPPVAPQQAPAPAPETPPTVFETALSYINNFVINIFSGIGTAIGNLFSWLTGR